MSPRAFSDPMKQEGPTTVYARSRVWSAPKVGQMALVADHSATDEMLDTQNLEPVYRGDSKDTLGRCERAGVILTESKLSSIATAGS